MGISRSAEDLAHLPRSDSWRDVLIAQRSERCSLSADRACRHLEVAKSIPKHLFDRVALVRTSRPSAGDGGPAAEGDERPLA